MNKLLEIPLGEQLQNIVNLANDYRVSGDNAKSVSLCKLGLPIAIKYNFPSCARQFMYHLSICSFYTGDEDLGQQCNEGLIFGKQDNMYNNACKNERFYVTKLNYGKDLEINFDPPLLDKPKEKYADQRYRCMNPSIITRDNGYWYVQRTSNFDQVGGTNYTTMEADGIVRTRNYLLKLDEDFNILHEWEIVDNFTENIRSCYVTGIEDIRLVTDGNDLYISGTTFYNHDHGHPRISWGKLKSLDYESEKVELEYFYPIHNADCKTTEKNWSPYYDVINDQFMFIYSHSPLKIFTFNTPNPSDSWQLDEKLYQVTLTVGGENYLRGSGGPIEFQIDDDNCGLLCVTHEVIYEHNNGNISGRTYLHRFIYHPWKSDNQRLISSSFYFSEDFRNIKIEFCIGLCYDTNRQKIILGVGINDRKAKLFIIDIDIVKRMLHTSYTVDNLISNYKIVNLN